MANNPHSNQLGLDYRLEAKKFSKLPYPIIDIHTHINGKEAALIYRKAAALYGVEKTFSMTVLPNVAEVKEALGDSIEFIAVPNFWGDNPIYDHGEGFLRDFEEFCTLGARIVKFWSAPRRVDLAEKAGYPELMSLNSPIRRQIMQRAVELNMIIMTHVGDPEIWFRTHYRDSKRYGTHQDQYIELKRSIEDFPVPWIAAHMGGWPENLEFLNSLLESHPNLYLDCSATKWIIRELSSHTPDQVRDFFSRWKGRILFGSDILTMSSHLSRNDSNHEKSSQSDSKEEAFDLYASRYWCLRTLFETKYQGKSPIADPDLHLSLPEKYKPLDAADIQGVKLSPDSLEYLYFRSAQDLLEDKKQSLTCP